VTVVRPGVAEVVRRGGPLRLYEWFAWWVGYERGPMSMSWLRQRWVISRHPRADIRFGRNVYLGPGFSLFIPENG
jgi:hypothetical protein